MADEFAKRYAAMVAHGDLMEDASQRLAVAALEELNTALQAYKPGNGGFLDLFNGRRRSDPPKGLYFHGDVGRGKSMLMDLFFEHAAFQPKRRVHFHEFMQQVHEDIHTWRQKKKSGKVKGDDPIAPVAAQIADSARLLCFDEFHVNDITDAMILGRLFSALFDLGVVVVATSNVAPADLYRNGLNRALFLPFIDVLLNHVRVVTLDGDIDYRLSKLSDLEVYYTPLGAAADEKMQKAWMRLTAVERGEPCELTIKGRVLTVPQAAMGVARFDFADLCDQPLGAGDYLKIAHQFHTLLIDRIPALDPDKRNQAKRFVTLIDTLYDQKVKLIASAAGAPGSLYPKGDHAFEFKRTVSRLREMQSADYLALGHGA